MYLIGCNLYIYVLTGWHSWRQNWTLTWKRTTESSENLKAWKVPCKPLEPLVNGWREGKITGSTGHPLSSSSTISSLLSLLRAIRLRASIPYTPGERWERLQTTSVLLKHNIYIFVRIPVRHSGTYINIILVHVLINKLSHWSRRAQVLEEASPRVWLR